MGLSYHYEFTAPAECSSAKLEDFLRGVEVRAKSLGFAPTVLLNIPFDTPERREFSRRLGSSFLVKDERLTNIAIPASGQLRDHDPYSGEARIYPKLGVLLVVTDEGGCESCFGFFKFPDFVTDIHGRILATTGLNGRWLFRDFARSPDPRLRAIVNLFKAAGYLEFEKDEFR